MSFLVLANILQPLIDVAESVILFLREDVGLSWGFAIVGLTFMTRAADPAAVAEADPLDARAAGARARS